MSVGYVKDCNGLEDLVDSIHRDNFREEKQMSEEINEDNCVLMDGDLRNVDLAFNYFVSKVSEDLRNSFNELSLRIKKLNEIVKEKQK